MKLLIKLLTFLIVMTASYACKCRLFSAEEAFKNAEWVSRVKILSKEEQTIDPIGYIVYKVEHCEIFKNSRSPANLQSSISTPSSSAACGLDFLETGKEYLLSGSFTNQDELRVFICGQITLNDESNQSLGIVLQWNQVPENLIKQLRNGTF